MPHFGMTAPRLTLSSYDAVEVAPCVVQADGGIDRLEEGSEQPAQFWGVYLHRDRGLVGTDLAGQECIADFPLEAQAEAYAGAWRRILRITREPLGLSIASLVDEP